MRQLCSKNRLSRRAFVKAASGLFVPTILLPRSGRAQALTLNDPVLGVTSAGAASNGLLAATVGYWKMDETLVTGGSRADATGNGWTATDHTGTDPSATGILNNAVNVNTIGKGLSVSASIDSRAQTTAFAVSFWINNNSGAWNTSNGVIATLNSGGIQGFLIYPSGSGGSSSLHLYTTNDAGTVSDVGGSIQLGTGAWHHVLIGYDGTSKYLYVDNVQDISAAVPGISRGHQVFAIGNYSSFGGTTGQASLYDEVAYLNIWPSSTQRSLIYNSGSPLPFSSYT